MSRKTRNRRPPPAAPARKEAPAIWKALDAAAGPAISPSMRLATQYKTADVPRTNAERNAAKMAMDFNGVTRDALTFIEQQGFPGFPTLSLLAQLPEYRNMHEVWADEVVRMWGKAKSTGSAEPGKLAQIDAELKRLNIRDAVRTIVIHDQAFGRAHAYFKVAGDEGFKDTPLVARPFTVPQGGFHGLRPVEAYWVTPNNYNSIDPSADDFYKPSSWWMLGTEVHATRLRTIISRPVADMLKPAYSFAGLSLSQIAAPYIDNWLRTRQSVSDTVKQYSISGIKMDLQQSLQPGANIDLAMRAELINRYRDNRNLLLLDLATEDFFQFSTPLSGLDALQAQAQEHQSSVARIPLIKLLGITPTGLNASSEGEIRVFYDSIKGYQTNVMSSLMNDVLAFVQLSLFGQIDPSIEWEWSPLMELTSLELSDKNNKDADTDSKYLQEGVVSPQQVAQRLNADPNSPYSGLLSSTDDMADLVDSDIAGITDRIVNNDPNAQGPSADCIDPAGASAEPSFVSGPQSPAGEAAPQFPANEPGPQLDPNAPQTIATPVGNPVEAGTPDEQGAH